MGKYIMYLIWATGLCCATFAPIPPPPQDKRDDKIEIFVFSNPSIEAWRPLQIAYKKNGKWTASQNNILTSFFGYRQKRPLRQMTTPYLFKGNDGLFHCVWAFGKGRNEFAHSSTPNFFDWSKQDNASLDGDIAFLNPIVISESGGKYSVFFKNGNVGFMKTTTADFKSYSKPKKIDSAEYPNAYSELKISGKEYAGAFVKIDKSDFDAFMKIERDYLEKRKIMSDTPSAMSKKTSGKKFSAALTLTGKKKNINKKMMGLFYEDILNAADGGIYPELVQNRDFEYNAEDNKTFTPLSAWKISDNAKFWLETENPISENNPTHLLLKSKDGKSVRLENSGWDGISLKKGATYDFSLFAKSENASGTVEFSVKDGGGKNVVEGKITLDSDKWKKYSIPATAKSDVKKASLALEIKADKNVAVDMVSLFPRDTFKGRKNGLRKDIAETLAALKPNFIRFPGGCIVHSDKTKNFYRWQYTIGKLEDRKPLPNLWGYHQTFGLGYMEYFLLCEDLNAEPIPVVPAGTACQVKGGECIPLEDMPAYVEEVLALIEWANGDPSKTKWGKIRAENGHPEPFNLKYLGIGNEDEPTENFKKRYLMIKDAVNKKYPEIIIIGSSGILSHGQDYTEGLNIVNESKTPIIDDHCYESPEWFIANRDFYDKRDRNGPKIYLGEYAPRNREDTNTAYTALCSAFYLMNMERNGDVVKMVSYAPLMAKRDISKRKTQMIHFDNDYVYPTPEYYVQKIFSDNSGDIYHEAEIKINDGGVGGVKERVYASVVEDSQTGETVLKLVNLLPVETEIDVDLNDLKSECSARKTLLTCEKFDAENVEISESDIKLGGKFREKMPPYSLAAIKFKKNN